MNAVTPQSNAQVMERVIADGDLSRLTPDQRLRYYMDVCHSLDLNPYTRPLEYIRLSGKLTLYAKRDAADQLRAKRGISLTISDQKLDGDLFIVHVKATEPKTGRVDEDLGAVTIGGLKGEARANAMLKATTKAKRRVTLSICGLGFLDETEVASIPDAKPEPSAMPELAHEESSPETQGSAPNGNPEYQLATNQGGRIYRTGSEWLNAWLSYPNGLVNRMKSAGLLDKLESARDMNCGPFESIRAFDPKAVEEVENAIAEALGKSAPSDPEEAA